MIFTNDLFTSKKDITLKDVDLNNENEIKEVISRWEEIGLLEGLLDEELKKIIAISFENCARKIFRLNNENKENIVPDNIEMIIYPILRRIIYKLENPRIISYDEIITAMKLTTLDMIIKAFVNRINVSYNEHKEFNAEKYFIVSDFERLRRLIYILNLYAGGDDIKKMLREDDYFLILGLPKIFRMIKPYDNIRKINYYDACINDIYYYKNKFLAYLGLNNNPENISKIDTIIKLEWYSVGDPYFDVEAEMMTAFCDILINKMNNKSNDEIEFDEYMFENIISPKNKE